MRMQPLVAGSVIALALSASAQPAEPWFGTWRLNVAKSTFNPGPKPISSTVKIEPYDGGLKQVVDTAVGLTAVHTEVSARFDGKAYPVKGNNANADSVALTRIDGLTYQVVASKSGRVTITSRVTHSSDGKTRTVSQTGTDARGQTVVNRLVYDRR